MTKENLHFIAYVSDAQSDVTQLPTDLKAIEAKAKMMNPEFGITGVLFYNDGNFLQVIEGDEADLRRLMKNIEGDSRHSNVQVLVDTPIKARGFGDWNMDCFNLSTNKTIERDTYVKLAREYKDHLLPLADQFVVYYKALLEKGGYADPV